MLSAPIYVAKIPMSQTVVVKKIRQVKALEVFFEMLSVKWLLLEKLHFAIK